MEQDTEFRPRWIIAALLVVLSLGAAGCAAPSQPPSRNVANPSAGKTEFDQDTEQCRRDNTVTTTFVGAYSEVPTKKVDEAKVQSCMTAHGWRPM